jgi:hypothetical protein
VLQALLVVTFIAMLALPAVMVAVSGSATKVPLSTALRILGLEAFTLLFVNIVTGAQSRFFYKLFKARPMYRFHLVTGVTGFLMALAHGVIVLAKSYFRGYSAIWVIGPVTLALLLLTIFAALDKKRLPLVWRRIHQINYLIFLAVFIKAVVIGSDVSVPLGYARTMKVLFIIYLVVAAVAIVLRIWQYKGAAKKSRAKAVDGPAGRQTGGHL